MNENKHLIIGFLSGLAVFCATSAQAEEKAATKPETAAETEPASEQDIEDSLKKLIFVPHDVGAPEVTDAGGVRAITVLPKIDLLAPDRMARTLSPTPTLYWQISKATEIPVRFTLLIDDPDAIDPLLETEIGGIDREGIYGIDLAGHGLSLENGKRYVWSVALANGNDGPSGETVAQTLMEHQASPELEKALETAPPEERAVRLAANGYWYDTVDILSTQIETEPAGPWQAARTRLLTQAGIRPHDGQR